MRELGATLGWSGLGGEHGEARLLIDHHWYLNWATPDASVALPWDELPRRACHEASASWSVYTSAGIELIVGEWGLASNHDAPLDLTDAATLRHLRQLFVEQLHLYSTSPGVVGSFFWTLRMGSGWDPRPTASHPYGRQLAGSSAAKSLPGYPYQVWSLLEMARLGVVTPLNASTLDGAKSCMRY